MTLGQIRHFITVVDEQSFSNAGAALFVSQPAISRSIVKLEEELGFPLLDRRNGKIRMTSAGRKLYDLFVKTHKEYLETVDEIRQALSASDKTIRIGCPSTWNPNMFLDRITEHFRMAFPSVHLTFEGARVPDLLGKLQSGYMDFIMTYELYQPLPSDLSTSRLTDIGCKVLYFERYFGNIQSLADLNGVDFLIFDVDAEKKFGQIVRKTSSEYGLRPKFKNFTSLSSAVFDMACGNGALLVTDWDDVATRAPFCAIPFPLKTPINLVYQASSGKPGLRVFADELIDSFSSE